MAGVNLRNLALFKKWLRGRVVRSISRQLMQSAAYLHSEGICHGDLTPLNLTIRLQNLNECAEAEIYQRIGNPTTEVLLTRKRTPLPKGAPK